MRKYEYTELTEQMNYDFGCWLWLLDGEIINPCHKSDRGIRYHYYDHLSLVQALNVVGEDGWQVVSVNDTRSGAILMREVQSNNTPYVAEDIE